MKKEDKSIIIDQIKATIGDYTHLYLTDVAGLNAQQTSNLRRLCFKQDVKLVVVKNTLLEKALDGLEADYSPLYNILNGSTSVMLSNVGNVPAKLIKEFSKDKDNKSGKPVLKGAYVEECFYIGEDQLEALINLKSKTELIGEIIGLLQSPAKNVISALQSGGNTLHGVLTTLSER